MSTPESITVSLDMAKKLKEAGWPQDRCSHFWASFTREDPWGECMYDRDVTEVKPATDDFYDWKRQAEEEPEEEEFWAAPTAEEILRRLPQKEPNCNPEKADCSAWLEAYPIDEWWAVSYEEDGVGAHIKFQDSSLANAAAALWIYLSDNKLLS